jgi:HlyD family secretion protein
MKRFLLLLVLIAAFGGAGWWWYSYSLAAPQSSFRTAPVKRGDLVVSISATGTLEPEEVVDIGAQVAGMILRFGKEPQYGLIGAVGGISGMFAKTIDYGSPVEPGTELAYIDESLYKAAVDQARANVQKAEADLLQMRAKLAQSDRDWQRAQSLRRTRGVISDLDYDTAEATFLTSKANVGVGDAAIAQANAALSQAEINLRYCTIKSPVKGVIVDRRVNVGQTVVSSLTAPSLFLIAKDLKRMQIWASVNEADIGQIHPGQKATFTVDAFPDQGFTAEVAQIRLNASMTQNVVTYTVVLDTDNSSGKLLPYLTTNIQFEVGRRPDALLVPNAALRWRPQDKQVHPDVRSEYITAQRNRKNAAEAKGTSGNERSTKGTVWVEDEGFVRPIRVRTGMSDGNLTEVFSDALTEDSQLVVGVHQTNNGGGGASPFTPQIFGGKKSS